MINRYHYCRFGFYTGILIIIMGTVAKLLEGIVIPNTLTYSEFLAYLAIYTLVFYTVPSLIFALHAYKKEKYE